MQIKPIVAILLGMRMLEIFADLVFTSQLGAEIIDQQGNQCFLRWIPRSQPYGIHFTIARNPAPEGMQYCSVNPCRDVTCNVSTGVSGLIIFLTEQY
jgi:hypothetical protein